MKKFILYLFVIFFCTSIANAQSSWQWQNPLPPGYDFSGCFLDHNTGWIVGQGIVSKTTDNGLNWNTKVLAHPFFNRLRSVSFFNQDIGLISANDCAFRSTNGGISWIKMDPGTPGTDRPWLDCQMTSSMTGWLVGRDVLKSINGGENWLSISMYPGEDMFWRCVFFLNSLTGWIGGDSYGIRTTDGGESWISIERTGISDIFFFDENTGWMTCSDGICKTTNRGDNWIVQSVMGASCLNFINENTGWASNLKTTDGGDNWFVQSNATGMTSIFFDSTLNGWRTGYGENNLYRSTDGGDNWLYMINGFRNELNTCYFVSETSGWVAGESGIIYATSNGGTNWNLQQSGINSILRSIFFTSQTDGWAGGNDLIKTTNAGITWELQPNVSEDIYSIYFQTHSLGFIGAQGKILRTTNAGFNWNLVYSNEEARVTAVLLNSSNTGWAVGRDGLILRSTDEGQSWSQINSPLSTSFHAVHFPSPSTGYIVGNYGPAYILKTTNEGDLWEVISDNIFMLIDPSSVHFFNNNTGWVSGNYGTIAKTTDGGLNWQSFFIGTDNYLMSMSFTKNMTGWVVGSEGTILKTTNGGQQSNTSDDIIGTNNVLINSTNLYYTESLKDVYWNISNYDLTEADIISDSHNDSVYIFSGNRYGHFVIYLSTAESILSIKHVYVDNPLPVELTTFISQITSNDVTLKWSTSSEINNSGFEIEKSNVKGQTSNEWSNVGYVSGNGTSTDIHNYEFTEKNLNSGKYKYRLKQIDFNGNFEYFELAEEVNIGIPDKYSLSQNYPNPFNPYTNLEFGISNLGFVTLKIYDVIGREIVTLVNEIKEPGYYTIRFDGSKLSSGIYFYRLTAGDFVAVKKLVVLK